MFIYTGTGIIYRQSFMAMFFSIAPGQRECQSKHRLFTVTIFAGRFIGLLAIRYTDQMRNMNGSS